MPRLDPLEYESRFDGGPRADAPRFGRRRAVPRHAHAVACLACLVVFWGNVATWALEGDTPGTWDHPRYDDLRLLWSVVAIVGIVYGGLAARAPGHGRFAGRVAIALNIVLLVAMWAWRAGLFNFLEFHT